MTLKELIARILITASEISKENIDEPGILIEIILPRCLEIVANNASNNPAQLNTLRRLISFSFVAGEAPLTAQIKPEWASSAYFEEDPLVSYIPRWSDYQNDIDPVFGKFTIQNNKIYYTNSSGVKPGTAKNVSIVCNPILPTLLTDQCDISTEILEQVIILASAVIAKQIQLPDLSLDYTDNSEKPEGNE